MKLEAGPATPAAGLFDQQPARARRAAICAGVLCGGWIPIAARSARRALRLARSSFDNAGFAAFVQVPGAAGAGVATGAPVGAPPVALSL